MKERLTDTRTLTLGALLGLTAVAWGLQRGVGADARSTALVLLALAFVKVRLILVHFIEVGQATWPVRAAFEAWFWGSAAAVLALT